MHQKLISCNNVLLPDPDGHLCVANGEQPPTPSPPPPRSSPRAPCRLPAPFPSPGGGDDVLCRLQGHGHEGLGSRRARSRGSDASGDGVVCVPGKAGMGAGKGRMMQPSVSVIFSAGSRFSMCVLARFRGCGEGEVGDTLRCPFKFQRVCTNTRVSQPVW